MAAEDATARSMMEAMHTMHKESRMKKRRRRTQLRSVAGLCFLRFTVKQHTRCFARPLVSPSRPSSRIPRAIVVVPVFGLAVGIFLRMSLKLTWARVSARVSGPACTLSSSPLSSLLLCHYCLLSSVRHVPTQVRGFIREEYGYCSDFFKKRSKILIANAEQCNLCVTIQNSSFVFFILYLIIANAEQCNLCVTHIVNIEVRRFESDIFSSKNVHISILHQLASF